MITKKTQLECIIIIVDEIKEQQFRRYKNMFDTTLFEKNDPKLAKKVKAIAKRLHIKGVVRISWIDAKSLVKKASNYFKELLAFENMENWKKDEKCYSYIINLLKENITFHRYMRLIKASNMLFNNR